MVMYSMLSPMDILELNRQLSFFEQQRPSQGQHACRRYVYKFILILTSFTREPSPMLFPPQHSHNILSTLCNGRDRRSCEYPQTLNLPCLCLLSTHNSSNCGAKIFYSILSRREKDQHKHLMAILRRPLRMAVQMWEVHRMSLGTNSACMTQVLESILFLIFKRWVVEC